MPTYKRESILVDVQAALALITVRNGFNTDVKLSTRDYMSWDAAKKQNLPMLIVVDGGEEVHGFPSNRYRRTMTVGLVGYVKKETDVLISTTINNLAGDIQKKLMEDVTRGTNAHFTLYSGMRVFQGLPTPIGIFEMDFKVEYDSTAGAP